MTHETKLPMPNGVISLLETLNKLEPKSSELTPARPASELDEHFLRYRTDLDLVNRTIKSITTLDCMRKHVEHSMTNSWLRVPVDFFTVSKPQELLLALEKGGVEITHKLKTKPDTLGAYNYVDDRLEILQPYRFSSMNAYLHTLFHEVMHWTGHPSRMDRGFIKRMYGASSDNDDAREETISNLGSMFLAADLGLELPQNIFYENAAKIAHICAMNRMQHKTDEVTKFIKHSAMDARKCIDYLIEQTGPLSLE